MTENYKAFCVVCDKITEFEGETFDGFTHVICLEHTHEDFLVYQARIKSLADPATESPYVYGQGFAEDLQEFFNGLEKKSDKNGKIDHSYLLQELRKIVYYNEHHRIKITHSADVNIEFDSLPKFVDWYNKMDIDMQLSINNYPEYKGWKN